MKKLLTVLILACCVVSFSGFDAAAKSKVRKTKKTTKVSRSKSSKSQFCEDPDFYTGTWISLVRNTDFISLEITYDEDDGTFSAEQSFPGYMADEIKYYTGEIVNGKLVFDDGALVCKKHGNELRVDDNPFGVKNARYILE